jgi:putative PIN family toxin of toxin-antitoxin system
MPKSKPLKVIIDTNLWISFIISNKKSLLQPYLINEKIRLLFSNELLIEIQETIKKPRLKKYFGANALQELKWQVLLRCAEIVKIISYLHSQKMARLTICLPAIRTYSSWCNLVIPELKQSPYFWKKQNTSTNQVLLLY